MSSSLFGREYGRRSDTLANAGRAQTYHPQTTTTTPVVARAPGVGRTRGRDSGPSTPNGNARRTPSSFGSGVASYMQPLPRTNSRNQLTSSSGIDGGVKNPVMPSKSSTSQVPQARRNMPKAPSVVQHERQLKETVRDDASDASSQAEAERTRGPFPHTMGVGASPSGSGGSKVAQRLQRDLATSHNMNLTDDPTNTRSGLNPAPVSIQRRGSASVDGNDGLVGFANLGNTCFMNATLQAVIRLSTMRRFLTESPPPAVRKTPITTALHELAVEVFGGRSRGYVSPSKFKLAVGNFKRAFAGYEQHDAQEFLRFMLDGIDRECNRVTKKPPYEELKDIAGEPMGGTAGRWFDNHIARNNSIVQDVFCGQFATTTTCETCGHVSTACDVFNDVSVSIPKKRSGSVGDPSVEDCLNQFFSESILEPDDIGYICGKCKDTRRARRNTSLIRLPNVLVVHLKRFRQQRMLRTKLGDLVTYPLEEAGLSLQPYMHPDCADKNYHYSLTAVVNHMGSCQGGHYTAYGKARDAWFLFDDSSVDEVSPSRVVSGSGYLLFFERTWHRKSQL